MYKNQRNKRNPPAAKSAQPVFVSQKRNEAKSTEKEKFTDNNNADQIIPSSQDQDVPASQNAFQSQSRFASQRHQVRLTQGQHQPMGKNYFENALIQTKVKITEISCEFMHEGDDPVSFIRRFRSLLGATNQTNNENANKFLAGFNEMFSLKDESIKVAQKFLSGLVMKEGYQRHQSQTSLIQCFFAVSNLRDEISKKLLKTLNDYVIERKEQADPFIIGLVVAQFKFSDQLLASDSYNLMYEKFFEILENTQNEACREVIFSNFRDFDEFKQDDAVKRLVTMYENRLEMLTPFIETVTEMCIGDETKAKISSFVQHILETGCEPKLYPGIVKYLLYYSKNPVFNLREHLKWNATSNPLKLKIVQLLEKSIRRQESKIADMWLKTVAGLEEGSDLKLLDFVMLLAIVSIKEDKLPAVKKIFIQKIPQGFFGCDFLKQAFKTFPVIIAQHSDALLELLNALQKSNVFEINEFSSTCFKELFSVELSDKKEIIGSLVQFLCEKIPHLPFGPRSDFKIMTLNILSEMEKEALLVHHKILLRVLNYSKVQLTFNEHRLVMELLCSLAFATDFSDNHNQVESKKLEEERAVLQEHLEMTMNKLMCSPDMKIKQLGIIGAIKIVGSLVMNIVLESDEIEKTIISIDDIPPGQIRDAANRVMFVIESVRGDPIGFAMICDELTLEFKAKTSGGINEIFLLWLFEMMFKRLDTISAQISQEVPTDFSHQLQVSCDYFDAPEIAYKLGMLTNEDVVFIPSLFQLVRLLSQHRVGGLSEVYVFSVMSITLPKDFSDLEDINKEKLDLHFNLANWLREIIGTFCQWSMEDKEALTGIVKQRVKQLVQIEKRLAKLLRGASDSYYPPPASFTDTEMKKKSFDSLRKEKKPPTKKAKKSVNVTGAEESDDEQLEMINKFCREIDTQVILLLMEKFKFSTDNIGDGELGLHELHFLLEDVFHKVAAMCSPRSAGNGFFDPIQSIRDINGTVVVSLVEIFQLIRGEFVAMSQKADDEDVDDVFYTKDANILKKCFSLILQLFTVIFTCPKLKLEKNKDVLMETLKTVIPADDLPVKVELDVIQLCFILIELGTSFEPNVKSIDCAVSLAKFLHTISKLSGCDDHRNIVMATLESFLKKQWKDVKGNDEEGASFNGNLETLLELYVEGSSLEVLEKNFNKMYEDFKFIMSKQLTRQETFPSFTKGNSIVMLRVYIGRLSQIIGNSHATTYEFWQRCAAIYTKFEEITKFFESSNAYILFLKHLLIFMKGFNTQGIAALKTVVKSKDKFVALSRSVQKTTRFAHGLSCDLKHRKNKSIALMVPKIREALTKLNQVIQPLIPAAGIKQSDFTCGALKNYDAAGIDIWSQMTAVSGRTSGDEEEDEVMEDDDTVGNLNMSVDDDEPRNASFRSRSTIL